MESVSTGAYGDDLQSMYGLSLDCQPFECWSHQQKTKYNNVEQKFGDRRFFRNFSPATKPPFLDRLKMASITGKEEFKTLRF
ncbi:unnamed protein product [Larinioides sclopetarius]